MFVSEKPHGIFCTDHIAFMPGIGQIGVEIKRIDSFYESGAPKKFWLIQVDVWPGSEEFMNIRNRLAEYLYEDDSVPLFIRQTLAIGYDIRTCENSEYYTTSRYTMPANIGNADFRNHYFQSRDYEEDLSIVRRLHDQRCSILSERALCSRIIKVLHMPWAAHRLRVFRAALHWRNFTSAAKSSRRRAHARTELLREELAAATWHPSRFANWCLDCDERVELAELFAKK
jgi:hypothetical protein